MGTPEPQVEAPLVGSVPSLYHPQPTWQALSPLFPARPGLSLGPRKPHSPRRHAVSGDTFTLKMGKLRLREGVGPTQGHPKERADPKASSGCLLIRMFSPLSTVLGGGGGWETDALPGPTEGMG